MLKPSIFCSFLATLALGVMGGATASWSHHPSGASGGGSGPIVTVTATTLEEGESAVSFTFESIQLDELSDATLISAALNDEDVHSLRSINSYALSYAYGVTNDFTLALRIPWIVRSNIREAELEAPDEAEVENLGTSAGLGDISLLGQYRFYNDPASGLEAALLAGIKAPTGKTDELVNSGEERFEAEFQPGSGSWDGSFGFAVTRHAGPWSFDANVLYTFVGTARRIQISATVSFIMRRFPTGFSARRTLKASRIATRRGPIITTTTTITATSFYLRPRLKPPLMSFWS